MKDTTPLTWRDRLQIVNSVLMLLLGLAVAARGFAFPSVPLFLVAAGLTGLGLYRCLWIGRRLLSRQDRAS